MIEHLKNPIYVFGGFLNGPYKHQLFGQAINVASRLEQLAIPGTIHVSEQLYSMIRSETALKSRENRKLHNLKGTGKHAPETRKLLNYQVLMLGHLSRIATSDLIRRRVHDAVYVLLERVVHFQIVFHVTVHDRLFV